MRRRPETTRTLTKHYTTEQAKQIMKEVLRDNSDPEHIFRDIAENLLPQFMGGTPKQSEKAKNWLLGKSEEAQMTMGLEHHYPLLDMVDRRYAALLLSIVRQIEKEYGCTTSVEKMLAENIAVAHIKIIDQSRRLNDLLEAMSHGNKAETTKNAEILSRQVDRATRQFYTAIAMLQQLRRPQLEVNILNRNTFVAQNQQINTTPQKS